MSASYTTSLRLWEGTPLAPALKNAWGPPLNENQTLLEAAITDTASVVLTGLTTYTLTAVNGAPDQARCLVQQYSGALTGNCTVTLPNVPKFGYAVNLTTGGFNVVLTAGAGTTASIPPDGNYYYFQTDGATNVAFVPQAFNNLSTPGNATIGGTANITGALTAASVTTGNVTISGNLSGTGGGVAISGNLSATGSLFSDGEITTGSIVNVTGQAMAPVANVANLTQTQLLFNVSGPASYSLVTASSAIIGADVYVTSDGRTKTNVEDITDEQAFSWILNGRPVTYRKYNEWGAGFIAQEELRTERMRSVKSVRDETMEETIDSPAGHRLVKNYECEIAYLSAAIRGLLRLLKQEGIIALPDA